MEKGNNTKIFEKLDLKYDIDELVKDWKKVSVDLREHNWFGHDDPGNRTHQTSVQRSELCEDFYKDGCGKLGKKDKKQKEREFTIVNPTFQGTIFEKICFDLKAHRGRLMKLMSKTAYSIHRDRAPRIHIAIDTNPDSMFLFPDQENKQIYHIPVDGHLYWVNTCVRHTFINGGPPRVHFVFASDEINQQFDGCWERVREK